MKMKQKLASIPTIVLISLLLLAQAATATSFNEEEVRFSSGGVTLEGTILLPEGAGNRPAIVLVHGAGPGSRDDYRGEAEAFAQAGIVTLIYDKRTEGYSSLIGSRSYALLAEDAIAAVRLLSDHPNVDPDVVGLWGLSEGAWVAPFAASQSEEIAFLVLVAATGVPPAQQTAWNVENELRHRGVSGSMVPALSHSYIRWVVAADLFAEATYDPVPAWEQVRQPALLLWGALDRIAPPAESAQIIQEALERGGNQRYTIQFFQQANHGLRASPDGYQQHDSFTPGYLEAVTAWVQQVAQGESPGPRPATLPPQARLSSDAVIQLAWYEAGGWLLLIVVILLFITLFVYPLIALLRNLLGHPSPPVSAALLWPARLLVASGLLVVLAFHIYLTAVWIDMGAALGPLLAGRPLPWLMLQILAAVATISTIVLAVTWWGRRSRLVGFEKLRLASVLFGGVLFIPWALYWGLILP
jgi:uncharacterized protein